MKLSEFKNHLSTIQDLNFVLPNGNNVPTHFHITEAGLISKHFIDCGGTVRTERSISFQIWVANDVSHKLEAEKLLKIITLSEKVIGTEDLELEVEYQSDTIGKYGLSFTAGLFQLTAKQTDCRAKENCGVPNKKQKTQLSELTLEKENCCTTDGGCCN